MTMRDDAIKISVEHLDYKLLCAKPRKTTPDGYYDDLIRLSCESRTKKYTKLKKQNKQNKIQ